MIWMAGRIRSASQWLRLMEEVLTGQRGIIERGVRLMENGADSVHEPIRDS